MKNINKLSHEELINLVTSQQKEIEKLASQYEKVLTEYEKLKLLIAMKNARTFKPKSESIDKEELTLFNYNDVEANASTTLEAETEYLETKKVKKAKSKNHESIDFESMVSETIIHEDKTSDDNILISEDITYKVEVNLDIKVIKNIFRATKSKETGLIHTPVRDFPFNNSIATPSLVSYTANEKFFMGTPLFRQEQLF